MAIEVDPFDIRADDLDIQVWRLSTSTLYDRANAAHAGFLGRTPKEITGKKLEEVLPHRDLAKWSADNEEAFSKGVRLTREIEVHDSRGRASVLLVTRSPVLGSDGRVLHLLCHAVDVTAERESRRHLGEASRAAQAASVAKRNFLANMSHEIRTPLNGVIGVVEILSTLPASEEQRRYLSILSTEARNILELVNGILDFSKIEAGRMEIERVPMSLADLASSLTETMSVFAARSGLELQLDLDPELPTHVLGDPTRLRQVLTNLLGNSLKFTRQGYVRLTIRRAGRRIRFEVADTGVGIPKERQESVFREFEQVDGSITRNYGGTGLGGTIARDLVRLMGSEIDLKSEVGVGTLISFDLSLPRADGRATGPEEADRTAATYSGAVLVADDNETNRQVAAHALGRLGLQVTLARDGAEAVARFAPGRYCLVLLDLLMPVMGGFEAAGRMREVERKAGPVRPTPIMALSASSTEEQRKEAAAAGMDDYLSKPITFNDLAAKVALWCTGGEKPQSQPPPGVSAPKDESGPVLDLGELTARLGDPALAKAVLAEFVSRLPGLLGRLEAALAAGLHMEVAACARDLAHGAADISARPLSTSARALEAAALGETGGELKAFYGVVVKNFERLREAAAGV